MTEETILEIGAKTCWMAIQVASPALVAALIVGLVVSIFQAATQINEQTLSFIPKILVMLIAIVVCGPWMIQKMMGFTVNLILEIPSMTH